MEYIRLPSTDDPNGRVKKVVFDERYRQYHQKQSSRIDICQDIVTSWLNWQQFKMQNRNQLESDHLNICFIFNWLLHITADALNSHPDFDTFDDWVKKNVLRSVWSKTMALELALAADAHGMFENSSVYSFLIKDANSIQDFIVINRLMFFLIAVGDLKN